MDTAPTGHALRLLEMPEAAREWTQSLLRILMKYRELVHPGRLAAEIVELSRSIRELQVLLRDHARTRFIVVMRAAALPLAETARLLTRLHPGLSLATPAVIVNALTLAPGRCASVPGDGEVTKRAASGSSCPGTICGGPAGNCRGRVRYHPDSVVRAAAARRTRTRSMGGRVDHRRWPLTQAHTSTA